MALTGRMLNTEHTMTHVLLRERGQRGERERQGDRVPSALIFAAAVVSNSTVPRIFAVAGDRCVNVNDA